jgi:hypothetical protein
VITGQFMGGMVLAAIHAQVRVALEQGVIVERRNISGVDRTIAAVGGNDRVDLHHALTTRFRIRAAVYAIEQHTAGVCHLTQVVEPYRLLVINPFQRHAGRICAQYLLIQLEHRVTLGEPVGPGPTLSGTCMQSNYQADSTESVLKMQSKANIPRPAKVFDFKEGHESDTIGAFFEAGRSRDLPPRSSRSLVLFPPRVRRRVT